MTPEISILPIVTVTNERVGRLALVQVRPDLLEQMRLQQGMLVTPFDIPRNLLQPLLHSLKVGQHQLGGHDPDVPR